MYCDIAALQPQGATIDGAPGPGYVLRPGFLLPPLLFSQDEIVALALGSRWVADRGDARLGQAARDAISKIASVLPADLRNDLDACAPLVGPGEPIAGGDAELEAIRKAIRLERKLAITYLDLKDTETRRSVWPFAVGFFDRPRVVVAWCELRQAFRHFRTDRITALALEEARYPRRRQALLKAWRVAEGIPPQ